jgi:transcriptional regulator with XRE-family HTH domain
MDIGNAIKVCRSRKKLTLAQLARRTNLSESYISLLERGERKDPTLSSIESIARGLEVPMSLLVFLGSDASETSSLPVEVREKLSTAIVQLLQATDADRQGTLV